MGKSEARQRTELASTRLYLHERQELEQAAQDRGVSVGEFLRQALRNELGQHQHSGKR